MASYIFCYICFVLVQLGLASQYISFDGASASSVHSSAKAAGSLAFAASQALLSGSGYWCSSGSHVADEVVSWTGVLGARHQAVGIIIDWAYAPGEVKVLVSPDGANFAEASPWRTNPDEIVSFVDHVMFDASLPVVTVTVVMRNPRAWKYFGLNNVGLIVEPGPIMFISGATSPSGPLCLVSSGQQYDVSLTPCIDAIASGTGEEIFVQADDGTLSSAIDPSKCLLLASGEETDGRKIVKSSCRYATDAGDGRGVLEPTATGQLKFSKMGNYCVSADGDLIREDVAVGSTISASSSQNGHPPEHVINGLSDTTSYWASALEHFANATVDVTLDFGKSVHVEQIEIDWELPAKSFGVELGSGGRFHSLFGTGGNALNKTTFAANGQHGRFLRIRMHEPHPVWSSVDGGFAYAIKSIRAISSTANVVAVDCTDAGESNDARDKFSLVFVPEFDPAPAENAKASAELAIKAGDRLSGLLAQLMVSLRALDSCELVQRMDCETKDCNHTETDHVATLQARVHDISKPRVDLQPTHWKTTVAAMGSQLDIDRHELTKLIQSTKVAVAAIKHKLEG